MKVECNAREKDEKFEKFHCKTRGTETTKALVG